MQLEFPDRLKNLAHVEEQLSFYEHGGDDLGQSTPHNSSRAEHLRKNPQKKDQYSFTEFEKSYFLKESSITKDSGLLGFLSSASTRSKMTGNRTELINRANSSIRELSESNRLRSQQKIKNEEMCFRFKLKMVSILRQLKFKSEEIEELQTLSPQNFILSFSHKLKNYLKEVEKNSEDIVNKIKAHQKIIDEKCEEISLMQKLLAQKEADWAHQK